MSFLASRNDAGKVDCISIFCSPRKLCSRFNNNIWLCNCVSLHVNKLVQYSLIANLAFLFPTTKRRRFPPKPRTNLSFFVPNLLWSRKEEKRNYFILLWTNQNEEKREEKFGKRELKNCAFTARHPRYAKGMQDYIEMGNSQREIKTKVSSSFFARPTRSDAYFSGYFQLVWSKPFSHGGRSEEGRKRKSLNSFRSSILSFFYRRLIERIWGCLCS